VGDYLAYSRRPPAPVEAGEVGAWPKELAAELVRVGCAVRPGYPVGPWTVDLCVTAGPDAVGLICGVHPDGVDAHIERQRALTAAGWQLVDAFASRWRGDAVRAALELAREVTP